LRPLTLSPETLAQGLLERAGASRGLLILCGLGRLRQNLAMVLEAEEAELSKELDGLGAHRGGPSIDELRRMTEDKLADVEPLLSGQADDLVLCASERVISAAAAEVGDRLARTALVRPDLSAISARRILLGLCAVYYPDDPQARPPIHVDAAATDIGGAEASLLDHLIEIGLQSGSIAVVADSPAVALREFGGHGTSVKALDLDALVAGPLREEDPADIDGQLLERLLRVL
jgi:hypothetical protein